MATDNLILVVTLNGKIRHAVHTRYLPVQEHLAGRMLLRYITGPGCFLRALNRCTVNGIDMRLKIRLNIGGVKIRRIFDLLPLRPGYVAVFITKYGRHTPDSAN